MSKKFYIGVLGICCLALLANGSAFGAFLLSEDFAIGAGSNFDDLSTHGWTKDAGGGSIQLTSQTLGHGDSGRSNGSGAHYDKPLSSSVASLGAGEYIEVTNLIDNTPLNDNHWNHVTFGVAGATGDKRADYYGLEIDYTSGWGADDDEQFTTYAAGDYTGEGTYPIDLAEQNYEIRTHITATTISWDYRAEGAGTWTNIASGTGTFQGVAVGTMKSGDWGGATCFFDNYSVEHVPEPVTLSLLAVGGLLVLARRRRG